MKSPSVMLERTSSMTKCLCPSRSMNGISGLLFRSNEASSIIVRFWLTYCGSLRCTLERDDLPVISTFKLSTSYSSEQLHQVNKHNSDYMAEYLASTSSLFTFPPSFSFSSSSSSSSSVGFLPQTLLLCKVSSTAPLNIQ